MLGTDNVQNLLEIDLIIAGFETINYSSRFSLSCIDNLFLAKHSE
jgi:hypothetical protein